MTRHIGAFRIFLGHSCAFTLAEVLITLGIIGVVAAMTIPTLIAKHRKNVTEAKLKKFYTTINQAITRSEVDNGDKSFWTVTKGSYSSREFFDKYLKDYLQYSKVKTSLKYTYVYLNDGTAFYFAIGENWKDTNSGDFIFCLDTKTCGQQSNGNSTLTNGKDTFAFQYAPNGCDWVLENLCNKGVEPYYRWDGFDRTYDNLKNACYNNKPHFCTAVIQQNGWKIPDDYPWIK